MSRWSRPVKPLRYPKCKKKVSLLPFHGWLHFIRLLDIDTHTHNVLNIAKAVRQSVSLFALVLQAPIPQDDKEAQ